MTEPMHVDLNGKIALVTGGGTGIGRAISQGLARCGCAVTVNFSKSDAEANETVEEITKAGGRAIAMPADITDEGQVEGLIAGTCEAFGGLDILVANAGGPTKLAPTGELSREDWDTGLDLNCKGVFYCVKHAIPRFGKEFGRVIVTSSISARSGGGPGGLTYAASKGAVNNMIRSWAKEYGPRDITVNAIAPGVIWTRLHQNMTSPQERQNLVQRIPLGDVGEAEDCVGATLLLASNEGRYITGQTIEINGGMQMP